MPHTLPNKPALIFGTIGAFTGSAPLAVKGINYWLYNDGYHGAAKHACEAVLFIVMITGPFTGLASAILAIVALIFAIRRRSVAFILPFLTWAAAAVVFVDLFVGFAKFARDIGSLGGK
jgi:hypothetical protein